MVRALIIGIDPGIFTGAAILDTEGRVLSVTSKRDIKKSELIKFVTKFGRPLIVATDVNPSPQSVEKLASTLGSKLYFPEKSLSVMEKQELIKEFSERIKNNHEADSLAAGIKAWKNYRDIFSKVSHTLEKLGLSEFFDEVVIKLLKEGSDNIGDAINKVIMEKRRIPEEFKIPSKGLTKNEYEKIIANLQKRLQEKDKIISTLSQQSDSLNRALIRVKNDLKRIEKIKLSFNEIERIEKENEELKEAIEILKKISKIEEKEFSPLIEVERIESSYLEELNRKIGLENRIVYCNSTENSNLLNNYKIKCLIVRKFPEEDVIKKLEFPVLLLDNLKTKVFDGIQATKKVELENELKRARKIGLIEWLKEYKERKE